MFGSRRVRVVGIVCASLIVVAFALHAGAEDPANPYLRGVWERTDKPVADGLVGRTWMWGPQANTGSLREPYAESPGGEREVQYYDKSRMEISQPASGDPNSIWYVTNGLLVVELISGKLQLGDNTFEERPAANVNVAGDSDDTLGPTYAALAGLRSALPVADGVTITQTVDRNGAVGSDSQYASFGVTAAYRVTAPSIDHQVASPFWSFMNASGPVYQNGAVSEALLFENPYFATGLPITEAYWARIKVGGAVKPVLLQCFERRCLTYTPDNPPAWQVEQGNVGQHYYQWRYDDGGAEPTATEPDASPTSTATASETPTDPPATDYSYAAQFGLPSDPTRNMDSPYDIEFDSEGNFYVVDALANRVQKFSYAGVFMTQWGIGGTGDGQFYFPYAAAIDTAGDIYIVDRSNHRIQKFDANGQFLKKWGTMGSLAGEFLYPSDIVIDTAGNIYTLDSDNHRVQKYNSEGLWLSMFGSAGAGDGQLSYPHGIDVDAEGRIYIGDTFNERIQVFDANGQFLRKWGAEGKANGQFDWPSGITLNEAETLLYVCDTVNDRVQVFDTNGVYQRTIGTPGSGAGQLDYPRGVTFLNENLLFIAEADNSRVQGFAVESGTSIVRISGDQRGRFRMPAGIDVASGQIAIVDTTLNGAQIWEHSEFPSTDWGYDELLEPRDLAFNAAGEVYVTDSGHNRIARFSAQGQLIDVWGATPGGGEGQFNGPRGIALDGAENVYVVDQENHRVQKFTPEGTYLLSWGIEGSEDGEFVEPNGIAVWGTSVFVTDMVNQRVQEFDLTGKFIRKWGSLGTGEGQFNGPYAIAVDQMGYLYVTDSGNNRIQKFTQTGEFLVQFGSTGTGNGQFQTPLGVAVETNGNVYVTDAGNTRVQIFSTPQ